MTTSKYTLLKGKINPIDTYMTSSAVTYAHRDILWCNKHEYINIGNALKHTGIRIGRNTSIKYLTDIHNLLCNHMSSDDEFRRLLRQIEYYTRSHNMFYSDQIESREERRLKNTFSNYHEPQESNSVWDTYLLTSGVKPSYRYSMPYIDYSVGVIAWVYGNPYMSMDAVFSLYNIYLEDGRETDALVLRIIEMLVSHIANDNALRDRLSKIAVDMELHGENGDPDGDLYRW